MQSSDEVRAIRDALTAMKDVPANAARAMPPGYYISEAFLELEREVYFRRDWACVGHIAEVTNPFDYFTLELAGEPLLVVKDGQGAVRVLSNVCRHRANLVAKGAGNSKKFACGYHAWTYNPDGSLVGAPHMSASTAFDKSKCGLPEFKSEIWQDFIFVNLAGNAGPLAPRLDAFLPKIANYHHTGRHRQHVGAERWQTNWKCLVENFMEGYHLSVAHARTLHPITPTSLCKKIPTPFGMTAYGAGYDPNVPERGPYHPDLTAEERRVSVLFAVFPNLVLGIVPNMTLYLVLNPVNANAVDIRWGMVGTVADPEHPDVIGYRDLFMSYNAEDNIQLEGVQKGLHSRSYKPGPLGPPDFEGAIWDFYQYAAAKLGSEITLD